MTGIMADVPVAVVVEAGATVAGPVAVVAVDGATKTFRVPVVGHPDFIPYYASAEAAGADLRARLDGPLLLEPGQRVTVNTGIRLELPRGYEGQVRPRSGLAARHGITILNAPGTIDSDYRGEVSVPLINLDTRPFTIEPGMRIAQLVIAPIVQADFAPVLELSGSDRGDNGFGSTGTQ